jgi:hypothetical protein
MQQARQPAGPPSPQCKGKACKESNKKTRQMEQLYESVSLMCKMLFEAVIHF